MPTYNDEKVIEKRIENLVDLNYPKDKYKIIEVGSNILAGTNAESIVSKTKKMINRDNNWNNPFGDGKAGRRIVRILERECE